MYKVRSAATVRELVFNSIAEMNVYFSDNNRRLPYMAYYCGVTREWKFRWIVYEGYNNAPLFTSFGWPDISPVTCEDEYMNVRSIWIDGQGA